MFPAATGGVAIGEGSLKLQRRPLSHQAQFAGMVRTKYQADMQDVSVQAADGAVLKGWYIQPKEFNGSVVIALHGITDNREGVFGYGLMFLERGYAVLLPDARAHGESGGEIATYGVKRLTICTDGFLGFTSTIRPNVSMGLASRTARRCYCSHSPRKHDTALWRQRARFQRRAR